MDQDSKLKRALTIEERLALLGVEAVCDRGDHLTFRPLLNKSEDSSPDGAEQAASITRRGRP